MNGAEVDLSASPTCPLCGGSAPPHELPFVQLYEQADAEPVRVAWWACADCRGWYASPLPSPSAMVRHFMTRNYGQAGHSPQIAADKAELFDRVLGHLASAGLTGRLLDVGCSFGAFLDTARQRGWEGSGQEPFAEAAASTRSRGFDVRSEWDLDKCGFAPGWFQAVTSLDVFYYSRHPLRDLQTYCRLLAPGGVLALRTSNRLWALRLARRGTRGLKRDRLVSRLLLGQFHALSLSALRRILGRAGFASVTFDARGQTRPWKEMTWRSRLAYGGAKMVQSLTLGAVNLAPGVLVFARKGGAG